MTSFDQKLRMVIGNLVVEHLAASIQLEDALAKIAQLTTELAEATKPPAEPADTADEKPAQE